MENNVIPIHFMSHEMDVRRKANEFSIPRSDWADRFVDAADTDELLRLLFDITQKQWSVVYPDQKQIISLSDDSGAPLALSEFISKLPEATRLSGNETLLHFDYERQGEQTGALLSSMDEKEKCFIVMWDADIRDASLLKDYESIFLLCRIFLKQYKRVRKNLKKERNDFLQLLLEGYAMTKDEIARQMKKYGHQFSAPYHYIIVTSFSSIYDEQKPALQTDDHLRKFTSFFEFIADKYKTVGGVTKKNNLFFIVPTEKAAQPHTITQDAEMVHVLHRHLDELHTNLSFTSGIGLMQDSAAEFHLGYRQAYTALRHTLSLFGKGTVLHFRDMGVFKLLLSNPLRPQLKGFLMDYFEPLLSLEYDDAWPLLETVYSYTMCGFNSRECARKIYVHHQTIRYRLAKIESLCNLDLKKPADLITMLVCLEILKLCPDYMQQIHNLEQLLSVSDEQSR